jgi:hypothetical protein
MSDLQLVISALREVGWIIAEHLEQPSAGDADQAITRLLVVLGTQELADAIRRLETGYGLRVVK